jgi:phosphoglycolate phosphatase
VRLGIVSSKLRHRILAILGKEGLSHTIDVVLGAEDVQRHKPDPQGLLAALERLQVQAEQSLYVGDHVVDAQAAARAEIGFVAVRTGGTRPESWGAAVPAPLSVIDEAGELLALLTGSGQLD